MKFDPRRPLAFSLLITPALVFAQAQATLKPDGEFRYALGAGASIQSGNTDASSVNISGDGVRATADSKWQLGGKALRANTNGARSAENITLGTQYDRDITPQWFTLGKVDLLHDKLANLASRASVFGGVGRHLVKSDTMTWDVSGGLGYTHDRYIDPAVVADQTRTNYGRAELLLAEESTHKWTPTTSFRQKLSIYPSLSSHGGYRGVFDAGLSVSMTQRLSLTAGLTYRYDSDPGEGLERLDTLFVTGIALKMD